MPLSPQFTTEASGDLFSFFLPCTAVPWYVVKFYSSQNILENISHFSLFNYSGVYGKYI